MTAREGKILDSIAESDFQIAFFDEVVEAWDVIDDYVFDAYEEAKMALTAYGDVWADRFPAPFKIVQVEGYVKLTEMLEDLTGNTEVSKLET